MKRTARVKKILWPKEKEWERHSPSPHDMAIIAFEGEDGKEFVAKGSILFSVVKPSSTYKYVLDGNEELDKFDKPVFMVAACQAVPDTESEVLVYLSSCIDGIGPATAKKIVRRLGVEAVEIIQNNPECLQEFLPQKKAESIAAAIAEHYGLKRLIDEVSQFKIPTSIIVAIYNNFRDDALGIVTKNPYKIAPVIGFEKADEMGKKYGLANGCPERIAALCWYQLRINERNGHTCMLLDKLIEGLQERQTFSSDDIKAGLAYARKENIFVNVRSEDKCYIYLTETEKAEERLVQSVKRLIKTPTTHKVIDVVEAIKEFEEEKGFQLAPEQKMAVECGLSNRFALITGGPGTGKTTIVNAIREIFCKHNPDAKVLLTAPTGKAANRLMESTGHKTSTLHKALGLKPEEVEGFGGNSQATELDYDLIIVDEVSMLDLSVANTFLSSVGKNSKVILIGDPDQLASVGAGAVLADMINSGVVPLTKLVAVYRQKGDSLIAVNAKLMRFGKTRLDYDDTFQLISRSDGETAAEEMVRQFVEAVNEYGIDNVCMLSPRRTADTPTGCDALNLRVKDAVNPPSPSKAEMEVRGTLFRVGDKVMNTKNNGEIANGDVGYIVAINHGAEKPFVLDFDGRVEEFNLSAMANVVHAYAITIHKSQGSEYAVVIMNLMMSQKLMLNRNLVYTGITRAKKKCILVGEQEAITYSILHSSEGSNKRTTLLAARLKHHLSV